VTIVTDLVDDSLAFLVDAGVQVADGLSRSELDAIQRHFRFEFGPDHRDLLSRAVPVGKGWYDWRAHSEEHLTAMLRWPIEGLLFDVTSNAFWPASWGRRPADLTSALEIAERQFTQWPKLVPLFSHRFMPAAPSIPGAPVLSVHQTDVIFSGPNLLDYLRAEFGSLAPSYDSAVDWVNLLPP
jgi:hypothetical protein